MEETISSKNNARMKMIRKLRARAERDRSGLFFVEGIRQVSEAIQTGAAIEEIVVAPELLTSQFALDLLEGAVANGTRAIEVSADVFQSISERERPHGLAAVVRQRWQSLDDVDPTGDDLWVGLDAIADPGNLGTILRTNEAVGGAGVILIDKTTDPFDPNAVRASMGAIFTQRLVRTTAGRLLGWIDRHQLHVAGTSPAATIDYQEAAYQAPLLLLMGSERQGLADELLQVCDPLVKLPMVGRTDSLNLAVATGVMLYEVFNQRRRGQPVGEPPATGRPRSGRPGSRRQNFARPTKRNPGRRRHE